MSDEPRKLTKQEQADVDADTVIRARGLGDQLAPNRFNAAPAEVLVNGKRLPSVEEWLATRAGADA